MRILFLSQLVPYPPDAGAKVRSYHLLQYLAQAGHEVTLVAFCRDTDSEAALDTLRQLCAAVHVVPMQRNRKADLWHFGRSILLRQPFLIARDHTSAMSAHIRTLLRRQTYDAVHADQLWMAQYALAAAGQIDRIVLDQHNAMFLIPERLAAHESNRFKRALLQREARLMRRYEAAVCRRFNWVSWVTAHDRDAVAIDGPEQIVIPICVDPQATAIRTPRQNTQEITFVGGLHWPPNAAGVLWFARKVWPQIRTALPAARLTIIGKQPPLELKAIADGDGRITLTGYVSDLSTHLLQTDVFVVPLQAGGGMRVKIIDAWAWGLPVVATPIGAEGIDYQDGHNLLIAERPAAFAAAVMRLFDEPNLAARIAAQGRRTVERCYDWRRIYPAWDDVYPRGERELDAD